MILPREERCAKAKVGFWIFGLTRMRKRGEPALKFGATYVSDSILELIVKVQAEKEFRQVNASFSPGFPSLTHSG